jgi:hypothetical protein
MNRVIGFVVRTIISAAVMFGVWYGLMRVLFPESLSTRTGIVTVAICAPLTQFYNGWWRHRQREGQVPVPPWFLIVAGLACLAVYVWWGFLSEGGPRGSELTWLLILAVLPTYLVGAGIWMLWRARWRDGASGT